MKRAVQRAETYSADGTPPSGGAVARSFRPPRLATRRRLRACVRAVPVGRPSGRAGWPCTEPIHGEFDPGSGRTLAACLTHASRAERPLRGYSSGERVSNTWATYLLH